jgi:hypothetical protein
LAGLVAGIRAAVEAPKGIPIRAAVGDVRSSDFFGIFRAAKEKADDLLPPAEIVDAAEKVSAWMEINGYRNWQLGGVCDRRFADECERLKNACDRWSEAETLNAVYAAARAVFDRWDTPLWKDVPATAKYINRLRDALSSENDTAMASPPNAPRS